jgi:hypothetical protein
MKIKCSKCVETAVVTQATDAMPTHWNGNELCEGNGYPGKVLETHIEPTDVGKNSHIIFQRPLEGQNNQ